MTVTSFSFWICYIFTASAHVHLRTWNQGGRGVSTQEKKFQSPDMNESFHTTKVNGTFDSGHYWDDRYKRNQSSGAGSYGAFRDFKAHYLNDFVVRHNVSDVIEFGCGDGEQLSKAEYKSCCGVDVSDTVIRMNQERFTGDKSKLFVALKDYNATQSYEQFDLSLSLDVIYHLVEDDVFDAYMKNLFAASRKFVVIYSTAYERRHAEHVRHRNFTTWVLSHAPEWKLVEHVQLPPDLKAQAQADPTGSSSADPAVAFSAYEKQAMSLSQQVDAETKELRRTSS